MKRSTEKATVLLKEKKGGNQTKTHIMVVTGATASAKDREQGESQSMVVHTLKTMTESLNLMR